MHPGNFADLRKSSFASEINLSWIRSPPFFFLLAFGPLLASALACFLGWCDEEATLSSDISETVVWKGLRGSWQGQGQNCILWFLTQILGSACGHVCGFLFPLRVSKVYKQKYHLPGTEERKTIQTANTAQAGSGNRKCWLCWVKQLATAVHDQMGEDTPGTNREPG